MWVNTTGTSEHYYVQGGESTETLTSADPITGDAWLGSEAPNTRACEGSGDSVSSGFYGVVIEDVDKPETTSNLDAGIQECGPITGKPLVFVAPKGPQT